MPAVGYAVIGKENTLSAAPTAKYFSFKGWSLEQKELAAHTDSDILKTVTPESADDITLYAVWDYDYTAPSMKSVEFGGDDEDTILTSLYQDLACTYSTFSLENGLGIYTPTQAFSDYDRYKIKLTAKYSDGVSSDYNRITMRARLSSITNQGAMAVLNESNKAVTVSDPDVFWLTTTEKYTTDASLWNTSVLKEYSKTWNPNITEVTTIKVDALRKPAKAADTSDPLQSANIDYIRFYRTGDKTVTYHLNDGSGNTFKVDDKAAVGVGYRLTGEVPTRDGFEFRGWATSEADAKTETNLLAPSAAIDIVNADVDLYACWLDKRPSSVGVEFTESNIESLISNDSDTKYSTRSFKDGLMVVTAMSTQTNNYRRYKWDISSLNLSAEYTRVVVRAQMAKSSAQYYFALANNIGSVPYAGIGYAAKAGGLSPSDGYIDYLVEKEGAFTNYSSGLNAVYIDILRKGYTAGDTALIDYIRFYRTGDKTVTYYLNDGTENTFKVDTKAAVGVDYRLTGDEPTRDGYDFVGWSTSAYATATVTSIDITNISDNNLYAVWQPSGNTVPTMFENLNSVRVTGNSGIRFAATVALSAKYNDNTEEIGFIIGRKDKLSENDSTLSNLVFGEDGPQDKGYTPDGNKYVYGVVYNKAENINLVYDNNGSKLDGIKDGVSEGVTCVVYNIKNEKTELAVRSYIKIGGSYYYSSAVSRSMYQVAESLSTHYDELSDAEKAWVDKVLGTTGGTTNE